MKKLKIYLDTSVISHLKQEDVPEKMADTLKLWEEIKRGKYEVYTSYITIKELEKCNQFKRNIMFDYLAEIKYSLLEGSEEINEVIQQILGLKILAEKSYDDCIHIASAVVNSCDIIVSWNFKHMVNIKTIRGVRAIADLQGYKNIDIVQPTALIDSEEE